MHGPVASIDLGTNTVRLLIARTDGETITPILIKRHITRLGGGFTREGGISPEAWERSLEAVMDFANEIRKAGVVRLRAVATSAVRDAPNGAAFCDAVFKRTGIRLEVIGGEEEGLLTLKGVLAGLDRKDGDFLVFDVGGGSTEYTLAESCRPLYTESLPLGVVRLAEGKADVASMLDKIGRELTGLGERLSLRGLWDRLKGATLVGTAGTATTLAAISLSMTEYDYRRVNNHVLTLDEIRRIFEMLLPLSPPERLEIPGLEKGREDLIIAGSLITIRTMELMGFERMTVSDFGLLEGILLGLDV